MVLTAAKQTIDIMFSTHHKVYGKRAHAGIPER